MRSFFVYILKCNDDSYYVGHTDDLEQRLGQHQTKTYPGYTSSRLPVQLVYSQTFESRDEAFGVERQMKKWSRKKKEALISGDFSLLIQSAKKTFMKK